jgi:hypothetical protein
MPSGGFSLHFGRLARSGVYCSAMSETVEQLSLAERFAHLRTPHNGRFFEAVATMLALLAAPRARKLIARR